MKFLYLAQPALGLLMVASAFVLNLRPDYRAALFDSKRELTTTFPGSPVTTRLPIDTVGDGKNERDVVRGS
jgi:hypothetical protein